MQHNLRKEKKKKGHGGGQHSSESSTPHPRSRNSIKVGYTTKASGTGGGIFTSQKRGGGKAGRGTNGPKKPECPGRHQRRNGTGCKLLGKRSERLF